MSYIIPIILALILHGGLLLLLIPHWFQQDDPYKKRQPRHIQAEMIDLKALMNQESLQKEFAAEQAKKEAAEKKRIQEEKQRQAQKQKEAEKARIAEAEKKAQQEKVRQEAQKQKAIEARKEEAEKKKLAEQKILEEARLKVAAEKALAEKQKIEENKKKELAKKQAEEKKRAQEKKIEAEKKRIAEAKRLEAEKAKQAQAKREAAEKAAAEKLAKEQASEQRRLAAAERSEKIRGDITAYIQGVMKKNWRRPSIARNGMTTKIEVRLFPSGEVDSVRIIESSGDAAFDKAAERAIYRAEKFPRVAEIDPIFFERELRPGIIIVFRPDDLRW
ncbi:cell envelope integrity protein TolA [Neptunomonas concharum]|uniref:cell envelope integrity protein TolA n=1 Tax=Neptunomonas concharum TaxID=1031538 RepID=UPI001476BB7F|nr:cell envelope integrity protein TolA [Neptunomonas concharum]